jgi:Domain of unknown function (DUF4340)
MKIQGLLIAAIVLTALTGALYWSNHHKPAENTAQASAELPPKILTLNEADITKLDLKKKSGDEVMLAKDNSGNWQITSPKPLRVDQSAMSSILSTLSSLSSDRLLEEKASDLKQFGLDQPTLQVQITQKDNNTRKLLIGDDTPTGNAVYAKLEGDPRVFTVPSYSKTSIDKGANDLRDKRLLPIEANKISRLELIAKKEDFEFGRNKDEWQIVKPKPLRADAARVDELVRTLENAKMDLNPSDDAKAAAAAFASGSPIATVKVTDASATQELQLRKKKDDYYAKSSAVEGVYKVTSVLGQQLDKSLDDFRNKKLFDFGFSDPNKIEMHDASKAYLLTRTGEEWSSNGKKMDGNTVTAFLDKLRDLSASNFVDTGFTSPTVDVTVTSNDGQRVEKVLLAKSGNKYIAKRENEPALYEIDSQSVTELQKKAGELKPVAESNKQSK